MNTTICCLLYGDYPKLAERCLRPISKLYSIGAQVRLGCNEVSKNTESVISSLFPLSDNLTIIKADPQIYKYPMMRALFNAKRIDTDFVMWFDDDSYIKAGDPIKWLQHVESSMLTNKADMLGSIYCIPTTPRQKEWRRLHCSWFKENLYSNKSTFATGGWWTIKSSILNKFDWPHPLLKHRGGDVLMGDLLKHQSFNLFKFNEGVAINADENGKESASKRRGFDESPV